MHLKVRHRTVYRYSQPVTNALQQLRLTPKSRHGQRVLNWNTSIDGGKLELAFDDQNMNHVMLMSYAGSGHEIVVLSEGDVETADNAGVVGKHTGFTPLWYFQRSTPRTRQGANIRSLAKGLNTEIADPISRLHALSARIIEAVPYQVGVTTSETTAEEALSLGAGVCQDHAHIFVAAARQLGFPARYVSGYLLMDDTEDQDASHAWAEVHIDPLGWVGFDVSNGISPDPRYVRVATGMDYSEAAPVLGLKFGAGDEESVDVQIQVQQ